MHDKRDAFTAYGALALLALVFVLGLCGMAHSRQVDRVCGGVRNVALCDLALQAGDSDAAARAAGQVR